MIIVPIYAALLALLFIALSLRVIGFRRSMQAAFGTKGDPHFERVVRVHANFAEYVPFALVLLVLAETQETPDLYLHMLGFTLLMGRISHAWGVSQPRENFRFRTFGMMATFAVIAVTGVIVLWRSITVFIG